MRRLLWFNREPRAFAGQAGPPRRSPHDARRNLRLVHRRLRHCRSERCQSAAGPIANLVVASARFAVLKENVIPNHPGIYIWPGIVEGDMAQTQAPGADPVAVAAELCSLLTHNAAQAESDRRLPAENVQALEDANLFKLMVQRR